MHIFTKHSRKCMAKRIMSKPATSKIYITHLLSCSFLNSSLLIRPVTKQFRYFSSLAVLQKQVEEIVKSTRFHIEQFLDKPHVDTLLINLY